MTLRFRKVDTNLDDPQNRAAFETLARWYADPEIKYAIRPNFSEEPLPDPSADLLAAGYQLYEKRAWFIFDEEVMVGEVTLDIHFKKLCRPIERTGWISVIIGERSHWRRGIGSAAMLFLEDTCRALGLQRIELGVFNFNERAIRLYNKLGYAECGRLEHFTYKPDHWYADIRMEKWL